MAGGDEEEYSIHDLTQDLDELAGRFRRRFQVDDGGAPARTPNRRSPAVTS